MKVASIFKVSAHILLLMAVFFWLRPLGALALPLPKNVIDQQIARQGQKKVSFKNIDKKLAGTRHHLVLEVSAAAEDLAGKDLETLTMRINGDKTTPYINRSIFTQSNKLDTKLQTKSSSSDIMKVNSSSPNRGVWQVFIPWAFLNNQKKHLLFQGTSGGDYLAVGMTHWGSLDLINSLDFQIESEVSFAAGSTFKLFSIDESYGLDSVNILGNIDRIRFNDLFSNLDNLLIVGQTRSSEVNPQRRGDRVWQNINKDNNKLNYMTQRLTGEAEVYHNDKQGSQKNKVLLDRLDEQRVGWNTAASAPSGVYGPWLLYYPEIASSSMFRSVLSRHGTYDGHYNPVGSEILSWKDSSRLKSLEFYPLQSQQFLAGSRVSVYQVHHPVLRYVIGGESRSQVSLNIPSFVDTAALEFMITARSNNSKIKNDELVVQINDSQDSIELTTLSAGDGRKTIRNTKGVVGAIPAGQAEAKLMSAQSLSIANHKDRSVHSSLLGYGGTPGESLDLYHGMWSSREEVTKITFKTNSGASFSPGSTFSLWSGVADTLNESRKDHSTATLDVLPLSLVVVAAIIVICKRSVG